MANSFGLLPTHLRFVGTTVLVACSLTACTVAAVGTERTGWHPNQSRITSCEEGCATWSDDGDRCVRLRDESLRHCTTEQLRRVRR